MLAKRTGIRADTIRYYERAGLLPPPARTRAGYRQYDESTADRLRLIKGAQRLGLLRSAAATACPSHHRDRRLGALQRRADEK